MRQECISLEPKLFLASNFAFGWRISLWALLLACAVRLVCSHIAVGELAGIVLLGLAFAHGVELQHQALHHSGFKWRPANDIIGTILGLPMLVSYSEYRITHLWHHRKLGTTEDREFFDYRKKRKGINEMLNRIFLIPHFRGVIKNGLCALTGRRFSGFDDKEQHGLRISNILCLGTIILLMLASILFHSYKPILCWLVALIFVASPLHFLIEHPEHFNCKSDSMVPYENTRTIRSNRFLTWFTNGNNFHVEHHCFPSIPMHRVEIVHQVVRPYLKNYNTGYLKYFQYVLGATRKSSGRRKN